MSILSLGIWFAGLFGFFIVIINALPSASTLPYPQEATDAINTLWGYTYGFNLIFPLDTLVTLLGFSLIIKTAVYIVWPGLLWLLKFVRGSTGS